MNDQTQWTVDIQVESGPHTGLRATLLASEIRVGRGLDNAVVLSDDHTVSGRHARLYLNGNQWFAEDLGSRNGLFRARGDQLERLQRAFPLDADTTLILGSARLRVRLTCATPPPPEQPLEPVTSPDVLYISLAEGQLSFRFSGSDPLARQYVTAWSPSLASGISRDLTRLAQRGNRGEACGQAELQALGTLLTNQMIPQRVTARIEALSGGALLLSHDSELIEVPWELALAGGLPWCERVALGRQVILGDLSQRRRLSRADQRFRMVIVADPRADLPEARTEAEAFLGSLERYRTFLDADFLSASRATLPSVLRALDGADFVYYVGHGVYDPDWPEASGWLLSDGVLGPDRLRNLEAPPRFVFSNACNSAEDIPQEKSRMGRAANAGMVSGLVMAGVEACIGARWPIRAESGSALALAFFHRALGGAPLGQALREARLRVRRAYGDDDLAWASFVLYGNPVQRLVTVAPGAVCK